MEQLVQDQWKGIGRQVRPGAVMMCARWCAVSIANKQCVEQIAASCWQPPTCLHSASKGCQSPAERVGSQNRFFAACHKGCYANLSFACWATCGHKHVRLTRLWGHCTPGFWGPSPS